MAAVQQMPIMNIQCDWPELLRNSGEKAWLSCSLKGKPSVYGEIISHGDRNEKQLTTDDGFEILNFDKRSITVKYPKWNCQTTFLAPSDVFTDIHSKSIRALDISSGGSLGVSACDNGDLNVWQTTDGTVRRELKGHLTEITTLAFFPSGVVILSGAADMQLKIWSAEDGSCAATLKGHRGGISDTCIIEKGRNVISCSRDGTARLWDCGTSSCLGVLSACSAPVNACAISAISDFPLGERQDEMSDREIGTDGKLLLIAREDNLLDGVGIYSRKKVFQVTSTSAFNTCCFTSLNEFQAGCQDGCIYRYDVRNTSLPLSIFQKTGSPILSITKSNQGVLICAGDGSCYLWNEQRVEDVSFTGQDCDAVYRIVANNKHVYTVCRDAKIRKYILS